MIHIIFIRIWVFLICFFSSVLCTPMFIDEAQFVQEMSISLSYRENNCCGIFLKWACPNMWRVSYYSVFRGDQEVSLDELSSPLRQKEWLDHSALFNHSYFYQVKAYNRDGILLAQSKVIDAKRPYDPLDHIQPPNYLEVIGYENSYSIRCIWGGIAGTLFRLYRSEAASPTNYIQMTETMDFVFEDTNVQPSQQYVYKIVSVGVDPQGLVSEIAYPNTVSACVLSPPTNITAIYDNNKHAVEIRWTTVDKATHYALYRVVNGIEQCLSDTLIESSYMHYLEHSIQKEQVLYYLKTAYRNKYSCSSAQYSVSIS